MRNDTRKINVKILKDQQTYGISFKGSIFIQVALNRRLKRLYPTENFLWKKKVLLKLKIISKPNLTLISRSGIFNVNLYNVKSRARKEKISFLLFPGFLTSSETVLEVRIFGY